MSPILIAPNGRHARRQRRGVLRLLQRHPATCLSGSRLTYTGLATWTGSGGTAYTLNMNTGALSSSDGSIY